MNGKREQIGPNQRLCWLGLVLVLSLAWNQADCHGQTFAIRGATIETADEAGQITNATILVREGEILKVGPSDEIEIPVESRVVDGEGLFILPGLVEPYFPVRLPGQASQSSTRTVTFNGRTFVVPNRNRTIDTKFYSVGELYDPYGADFRSNLRGGQTRLNLVSAYYGQSAVLRPDPEIEGVELVEPKGRLYLSVDNEPKTLALLRAGVKAGSSKSSSRSSSTSAALWKSVLEGKSPLIVNVGDPAAILYLLEELKDQPKANLAIITSGDAAYRTLDRLKGRENLEIILTPQIETRPNSRDQINLARMVEEAGIPVTFRSASRSSSDMPLFALATLVRAGLPRQVAIEAATIRPAKLIGQGEEVGSIVPGKRADLLIFEGDPFTVESRLIQTLIEGSPVYGSDFDYASR